MAELGLERHPAAVSHSELTAGHDVTHLLSQINQNFEHSKADQILRLLHSQDRTADRSDDDTELLQEYDKIREEKVICDNDTLTDSSSISDIVECDIRDSDTDFDNNTTAMSYARNTGEDGSLAREYRNSRSRTAMGFHGGRESEMSYTANVDTRDVSIRPKSSYVRRRPLKTCFESEGSVTRSGADDAQPQSQHRLSKSARPKSRLGRASVARTERKIVMVEADTVNVESPATVREEPARENTNNTTNAYDRFSSVRQAKRESKRGARTFCDTTDAQQTFENMNVDSNSLDIRDEVTEVQPIMTSQVSHLNKENEAFNSVPTRNVSHMSMYNQQAVPRNSNVPPPQQQYSSHKRTVIPARPEHNASYMHSPPEAQFVRSDTIANHSSLRSSERREHGPSTQLKRTNSNLGYRSKHAEPSASRPVERPDIRPSTRTRRLQRRYMPQAPPTTSHVRPTSESIILARQKTEKNLLKKQMDNRPHSEKIPMNMQSKNMISISENPTQGPQTYVTSKGGVTQASHVQHSGFRGYDPGNRLKSGTKSRDFPSDLTLPRQGQNNGMVGSRKTLAAMMKLPPLEASLAAKKKERGLALAQRETCV